MPKIDWTKLQEFQDENNGLFIMIADPRSDEVSLSFNKQTAFVRFPFEDMAHGVVFNCLRKSKFSEAIDAFIDSIAAATGIDVTEKSGNDILSLIGGSMRSLGIGEGPLPNGKLEVINKPQTHGSKNSRTKGSRKGR